MLLRDCILCLCDHQFVSSPFHPNKMFKYNIGSGLGVCHSGEAVDMCWYNLIEKPPHRSLSLRLHKISGYWRFKDDILVAFQASCLGWEASQKIILVKFFLKIT